jgi:hypothetical protein
MASPVLNILVEGDTEAAVVKHFLKPYWPKRFSGCVVINSEGSGNLKNNYVKNVKRILSKKENAVLLLIDIKNDPFGIQSKSRSTAEAYSRLRALMYASLALAENDRLGVFPVVVEIETWLLADPTFQKNTLKKTFADPEDVSYPTNVIKGQIKTYRKGASAKRFFDAANAVDVYHDNCPHFIRLVDWLTGTASATIGVPEAIQAQMTAFQVEYDELTGKIE